MSKSLILKHNLWALNEFKDKLVNYKVVDLFK